MGDIRHWVRVLTQEGILTRDGQTLTLSGHNDGKDRVLAIIVNHCLLIYSIPILDPFFSLLVLPGGQHLQHACGCP